ncbi:Hypothetical_protein [Hexamita inflata]|uniref:Hypothetical_protein n=1 Tax=Hexamita inflata TaxID=28002 RepID=A0AA86PGN5_9EUKA|nr:Hypothetical protein HINF_LOCUS25556 [Hexamita inflata]
MKQQCCTCPLTTSFISKPILDQFVLVFSAKIDSISEFGENVLVSSLKCIQKLFWVRLIFNATAFGTACFEFSLLHFDALFLLAHWFLNTSPQFTTICLRIQFKTKNISTDECIISVSSVSRYCGISTYCSGWADWLILE